MQKRCVFHDKLHCFDGGLYLTRVDMQQRRVFHDKLHFL